MEHRGQHLEQLEVRRVGLGHVAQQVGVEHGGAVEVVVDGEHLRHHPAGRSGTEDRAQRQHGVARDLVAGEGGEPAGTELGGCHPAAPVQVDREPPRDHAVHQTGRHRCPCRGPAPDSTLRLTHGWLSTSERYGGRPVRSHETDQ